MFGEAIDIALKLAVKSNYVLQRTFINFNKSQFQTGLTKNPKNDKKSAKNLLILAFPVASPLLSTWAGL